MMQGTIKKRWRGVWLCALVGLATGLGFAQADSSRASAFTITVVDENGVAVPQAIVLLTEGAVPGARPLRRETDFDGRCDFPVVAPGKYRVDIAKLGFYRFSLASIVLPESSGLDVRLAHEQEIRESVDVVESPPAIDSQKTSDTETLNQREILNVPYPTTRDIRNALPMLPGVVMDQSGQIHVAGSSRTQTLNLLDGFDVSQPVAGSLEMRVNADAVRTIDVDTGRYTVQYSRGDSVLGMNTGIGDDRFRFAATNFVPSFQQRKGFHFNQWVPRAIFSGPIKRGKAWFYLAPEIEYTQTIVNELPDRQDRAKSWRTGSLFKLQVNLTDANILTGEFLYNSYHSPHAGLSAFTPLETTSNQRGGVYVGALKDQHYFKSGTLLENGFAVNDFSGSITPRGDRPYQLTPEGTLGSYYATTFGGARRYQWITNAYLPPWKWHGRHEFRVGGDLNRLNYHRSFGRAPIAALREDGSLTRRSTFTPFVRASDANLQAAVYAQDRWSPVDRLVVEAGLRIDWDAFIEDPVVAPRVGATLMLDRGGDTKLSGGVGLFYLATNLDLMSRPRTGQRFDLFYAPDGVTALAPPTGTRFLVRDDLLKEPRSVNWSLGLERRLPRSIYVRAEYLDKHVTQALAFAPLGLPLAQPGPPAAGFLLTNARQDRYQSLTLTARHSFRNIYPIMLSYTRSTAHNNALIDYGVDNLAFGPQQDGPLPWDTPNRILAWGWLPFLKKIEMGYSLDWHDGFPFTAIDQQQLVAGQADSYRFPRYFSLALAAERRFNVRGYYIALRANMEDVTGRENPTWVNTNVDSRDFHTFSGFSGRAVTGRIRFLGRSKKKP